MKGAIPRAGPKYRLGMYFETIHNLPRFDDMRQDEDGYTSYWETDTEVDSDLGNFIFNNVSGDSASVICIDDAVDIVSIRERQLEAITQSKQSRPHYKLEQDRSSPMSPTEDRSLGCSTDSKRSLALTGLTISLLRSLPLAEPLPRSLMSSWITRTRR